MTGPSGSGKSTLLSILSGLDSPTDGRVALDGDDITSMDESDLSRVRNAKIGIVFQSFQLIGTLTARENVEAPLYVGRHRGADLVLHRSEKIGPHRLEGLPALGIDTFHPLQALALVAVAALCAVLSALVVAWQPTHQRPQTVLRGF